MGKLPHLVFGPLLIVFELIPDTFDLSYAGSGDDVCQLFADD